MAGVRGFQQDPAGPPGMGMFDFEDGSSLYAHNPEAAAPFMQPEPEPDQRTASVGGALRNMVNIAGGPLATALVPRSAPTGEERRVERSEADVGPNMSPAPVEPDYSQAPQHEASAAPLASESPAPAAAAMQPAPTAAPTPQAHGGMPAIPPFIRTAATPGGYRPQSQSVEQTGSAVPSSVLNAYLRSRDESFDQELAAKHRALTSIAEQEDAMQVRAMQRYEAQQKAMAAAQEEHEEATRNIDSDFAQSNMTHRIGLAIAQGLMTIGAIWNNRQPPNMDWVQHEIDRDVRLQQDAYRKEGLRAQNKLTELMQRHQLSSEQAAGVLKNLQATKAALIGERYAVASGTPQMQAMWEAWKNDELAKRRADTFAILRDAAGTAKTLTSSKYQQASAGGLAINPNYKALLNLRKEEAGVAKAEHETGWAAGTVFPDEGTFQRSYLQAVQQNPDLTPEQFKHANLEKGGGAGGKIPGRLAGAVVKEGQVQATADRLAKEYGVEKGSPGWVEGKAKQIGYYLADKLGVAGASGRQIDRTMLAGELAAVATGGAPDMATVEEYRHLLDTNDPRRIATIVEKARASGLALRKGVQEVSRAGVTQEPGFVGEGGGAE